MRSLRVWGRWWILAVVICLALLPGVAAAQGTAYTVRPGDTLNSIAARHGATAAAIVRANGLSNPDFLRVGQQLVIPTRSPGSSSAGQASSGSGNATYTVKAGDTLAKIAARFGVNARAIIRANNIANPDLLRAGAKLTIPGASSSSSGSASSPSGTAQYGKSGAYNRYGGGLQNYLDPTRFAVSISKQHCWLLQNNEVTGSWPCSTGRRGYATPPGFYTIQSKVPVAYGSRWNFCMPYWLGIYFIGSTENGIHGLPYNKWGKDWADEIGTPISFGCIVLDDAAAEKLYSVAYIGMQVIILK